MKVAAARMLGLFATAALLAMAARAEHGSSESGKIIRPLPLERPGVPATARFNNDIDRFIAAKQAEHHVKTAPLCDDLDFVRRVYLDLVGAIPTEEQVRAFLDVDYKRREKLIDRLLDSSRYADHWSVIWGDLLREQSRLRGADPFAMRDYIRALAANKPYDDWVREMLIATGNSRDNPATTFVLRNEADPIELTISTTQVFLGVQLKCAQCHDHPFEAWEQRDFDGMTQFFNGTRRRRAYVDEQSVNGRTVEVPIDEVVDRRGARGEFMTGAKSDQGRGREGLADLVVRRDNPYFARAAVNRLWASLVGRGIVDPVDGFSVLNPPSHPELLDWLALEFIESGYNLKHVIRLICTSRTYQLSSDGGRRPTEVAEHERLFERMPLRRMTAEQLHDSILVSTGLLYSGRRQHRPAIEKRYPAGPGSFLATFGCHERDTIHERVDDATIPQALALLNGDFVNQAVRMHERHPIRQWLSAGMDRKAVVERLFMQTVGREPSSREMKWALEAADSRQGWSDLHWALLNTREFMFIR